MTTPIRNYRIKHNEGHMRTKAKLNNDPVLEEIKSLIETRHKFAIDQPSINEKLKAGYGLTLAGIP